MLNFLKKSATAGRPSLKAGEQRLTLAAFGKHPGWDDHIPGIGIETDTLAFVKQSLYVSGIGGQLDSGEWKRLEPDKRLEGFDHVFLWLRDGHVVLGRFWSSTDGKGRKEYPMVVCVDGEGMDLSSVLVKSANELEQLHEVCRNTDSADQVYAACRMAQERLRISGAEPPGPVPGMVPARDVRRHFLEHERLGPNHVGLLRVFHQLDSVAHFVPGGRHTGKTARDVRSCHLRLPLIGDSHGQALQLWSAFLKTAVSKSLPLLFIIRAGVDWLDVIIGEPTASDLFCLQASSSALPLVTEIPYELTEDSSKRLRTLMNNFLDEEALAAEGAAEGPVSGAPGRHRGRLFGQIALLGVVLAAAAGTAYWYVNSQKHPLSAGKATGEVMPASQLQEHYDAAMRDGQTALSRGDYTNAWLQAGTALDIKPGDAPATKLKSDIQTQLAQIARKADADRRFQAALAAAQLAYDHTDYSETLSQANAALALKPGDATAGRLRNEAQQGMTTGAEADADDWRFQAAVTAGLAAYDKGDYQEALAQANIALGVKPTAADATKLKSLAQEQIELAARKAENDRKFQAAMAAAQTAFGQTNFTAALAQAKVALGLKPNDAAATKLQSDAQKQMDLAAQANKVDPKFQAALAAGQAAYAKGDFTEALAQAAAALSLKTNDPVAVKLQNDIRQQVNLAAQARENDVNYQADMDVGRAAYARKEYATAIILAEKALVIRQNDAAATKLKADARQMEATTAAAEQSSSAPPARARAKYFTNDVGMEFIRIQAPDGQGVLVGKYEVTQQQFKNVMGRLPDGQPVKGDDFPVANVPFKDAEEFCKRLGDQDGKSYYLPSRAEWLEISGLPTNHVEDAWDFLRGKGALDHEVTSLGLKNELTSPERVGNRGAESDGLYDFFGNVREWVKADDGGLCAGFAYNSAYGGTIRLFFDPSEAERGIVEATGFRCFLVGTQ